MKFYVLLLNYFAQLFLWNFKFKLLNSNYTVNIYIIIFPLHWFFVLIVQLIKLKARVIFTCWLFNKGLSEDGNLSSLLLLSVDLECLLMMSWPKADFLFQSNHQAHVANISESLILKENKPLVFFPHLQKSTVKQLGVYLWVTFEHFEEGTQHVLQVEKSTIAPKQVSVQSFVYLSTSSPSQLISDRIFKLSQLQD